MSEDHQWRQLGSIVNTVLLDARTKAIRTGAVSAPTAPAFPRKAVQAGGPYSIKKAGNGFLRQETPAAHPVAPVQLELPFGIAAAPDAKFGTVRSPRGARLM